ncbi:MAG: VWA domain-containing protein [Marinomonas sp.]
MKWLKVNTVLFFSAALLFWAPISQADTQFRVIVDASGSMIISDPDKLTSEALRLISNLAPEEEATLGIWLFGEAPRVLLPESVVNKNTKAKLASYVDSYVTQDVQTDLEAIIKVLLETPSSNDLEPGFNQHWILVTDGMVDISLDDAINQGSRNRILNELTSELESQGIHLHTISMTGYTDKELLETLSLRTEATHTEVAIPEDLLDTFDRIFTQAAPSDELPFDGNHFLVDDAIEELTLVVFHESGIQPHILKPNGQVLSLVNGGNTSVAASNHYTLITITEPDSGEWQISNADLDRSSIRVITDLSAQVTKVAPVVFQNEPIYSTVGLYQEDILIQDEDILNLLSVKQTLSRLNGENKDVVFSNAIPKRNSQFKQSIEGIREAGNYELTTEIDGKTFSRQLTQYFTVHPGIEFEGMNSGSNLVTFSAKPVNLKLNVMRSNVQIEFTDESGAIQTELMPLIGQGYWEKVVPVAADQHAKVRARLIGVTQTGMRFDYWTPYWHFDREGENAATVQLGDDVPQGLLVTPVPSSNRDVMPILVPPAITVVNEVEGEPEPVLPETNNEITEELETEQTPEEVSGLSTTEWIMYAALNLGAIVIIGGGIFLYRRLSKKNKSIKGDDVNDV